LAEALVYGLEPEVQQALALQQVLFPLRVFSRGLASCPEAVWRVQAWPVVLELQAPPQEREQQAGPAPVRLEERKPPPQGPHLQVGSAQAFQRLQVQPLVQVSAPDG
jgi:hypothetical protein